MNKDNEDDIISKIIEFYQNGGKYNKKEYDWGPDVGREFLNDENDQNQTENKYNN